MASNFTKNEAWRVARGLVKLVYAFAEKFPPLELYALGAQMRRAVHSVHLNIAEGQGRLSNVEWQQFLGHARGSLMELESASIAAFDLHYCTKEEGAELAKSIRRCAQVVNGCLRSSLRGDFPGRKFKSPPANGERRTRSSRRRS
jgi:four helix bundle protein